jgi:hypothetical protein
MGGLVAHESHRARACPSWLDSTSIRQRLSQMRPAAPSSQTATLDDFARFRVFVVASEIMQRPRCDGRTMGVAVREGGSSRNAVAAREGETRPEQGVSHPVAETSPYSLARAVLAPSGVCLCSQGGTYRATGCLPTPSLTPIVPQRPVECTPSDPLPQQALMLIRSFPASPIGQARISLIIVNEGGRSV